MEMVLDVPGAELAVLEALWAVEGATIRDLMDRLYPKGGTAHYATVQKLLERLEAKGLVLRERTQMPHRFTAGVTRDAFVAGRVRNLAEQFTEGAFVPLVTSLIRSKSMTARERRELRELLEELEGGREKSGEKGDGKGKLGGAR